jgi:hypothetical protein
MSAILMASLRANGFLGSQDYQGQDLRLLEWNNGKFMPVDC